MNILDMKFMNLSKTNSEQNFHSEKSNLNELNKVKIWRMRCQLKLR